MDLLLFSIKKMHQDQMEANGLRKSVINDIVGATSSDQKALFFEGLCKLLAGFKNQDDQKSNSGDGSSSASTSK